MDASKQRVLVGFAVTGGKAKVCVRVQEKQHEFGDEPRIRAKIHSRILVIFVSSKNCLVEKIRQKTNRMNATMTHIQIRVV